jgi:AmiR/NasT family two-component response regulator
MSEPATHELRILVADENHHRLERVAQVVRDAGHHVIARAVSPEEAIDSAVDDPPDVVLVAPGRDDEHALELVTRLVEDASWPVLLYMERDDPDLAREAARLGVYGTVTDGDPGQLQSSLEVALRRFDELRELEAAFRRRALIERAKGVLMERHGLGEREAFELLRSHARSRQERVVTVAEAVLEGHGLLPRG